MNATLVVQVLGGLTTMSLSAPILGAEGLGVLAAVAGLLYGLGASEDTVTTFVTRGVVEGKPEEAASIFRFTLAVALGWALIAYAVIAVLAFTAAGLLRIDQDHRDVMLLYGVAGILTAMNGEALAALRLADRVQLGLAVTVASTGVRVGLLTAIWLAGGGIIEVVLVYVTAAAVRGLGMFAAAVVSAPLAGLVGFLRSAPLKVPPEVVRFRAGGGGCGSSLSALTDNTDVILLGQFAGAADVGLYRAARTIVDTARRPIGLVSNAVKPEYSRQWYSGRGASLRRTALRVTVWSVAVAVAGFGLLAVFREPIIRLSLGDAFSGAAPLLLILILGALPVAAAFRMLPAATGHVWPSLLSRTAGLAVFLAAMLWLGPEYGAEGAAWARAMLFLVAFLVITPFAISILRQSYRL